MTPAADAALDPRDILREDLASAQPFIMKRLTGYAFNRTRERARDVAQEAVALVLAGKGWHAWTHDGRLTPAQNLLSYLFDLARDIIRNEGARVSEWREIEADELRDHAVADPAPAAGERSPDSERPMTEMRRADLVMERLDDRTRDMLRLEAESDGELDASTLAERLGWTVRDVYGARERVSHLRAIVLERERKKRTEGGR
jgi:hypothetical protein